MDFQLTLTNASVCWQTVHAGVEAGYTTEHGRWFWQATRQAQQLDKLKPMTSLADFERLKAELRVPSTWIIVWHVRAIPPLHPIIIPLTITQERVLDLSQRLRAEANALTREHGLHVPHAKEHPLEQQLLPYENFRPKGMDEMWAQVREMEEREESEIIGRFIEYDRQNTLFPKARE